MIDAATDAGKAILERDSVINELRDSVAQSAQHVRHLQQQLTKTTTAVLDTGGQQGEVSYLLASSFFAIFCTKTCC